MKITLTKEETRLTIALEGRLDTTTAPELEKVLKESLDSVTELTLDFAKLDYRSMDSRYFFSSGRAPSRSSALASSMQTM